MRFITVFIFIIIAHFVSHAQIESVPSTTDRLIADTVGCENIFTEYHIEKAKLPYTVKRYLKRLDKSLIDLEPSVPKEIRMADERFNDQFARLHFIEDTFSVPMPLDSLWQTYILTSPIIAWHTKSSHFGMAYDKTLDCIYYDDSIGCPSAHEDMIFFLKLTLAFRISIPVAFEITLINPETKTIEFTYLADNKSQGRQVLEFSSDGEETIIKHSTYYTSGRRFRDKVLYPPLHNKIIADFHHGMFTVDY